MRVSSGEKHAGAVLPGADCDKPVIWADEEHHLARTRSAALSVRIIRQEGRSRCRGGETGERREPRERERETLLCASVSAENEPSSEPRREGESRLLLTLCLSRRVSRKQKWRDLISGPVGHE